MKKILLSMTLMAFLAVGATAQTAKKDTTETQKKECTKKEKCCKTEADKSKCTKEGKCNKEKPANAQKCCTKK